MDMKSLELNEAENTIIRQRETIELQNQSIQELNEKLRVAYNQISDQGRKSQLIDQQQAEIERLKAALDEIGHFRITGENKDYIAASQMITMARHALGLVDSDGRPYQQQSEPPKESLTPAELGELAGKAEALRTQILRILARSEKGIMFPMIAEKVPSSQTSVSRELGYLMHDGLVDRLDAFRYNITAAGRDYLASLDKPKVEHDEFWWITTTKEAYDYMKANGATDEELDAE